MITVRGQAGVAFRAGPYSTGSASRAPLVERAVVDAVGVDPRSVPARTAPPWLRRRFRTSRSARCGGRSGSIPASRTSRLTASGGRPQPGRAVHQLLIGKAARSRDVPGVGHALARRGTDVGGGRQRAARRGPELPRRQPTPAAASVWGAPRTPAGSRATVSCTDRPPFVLARRSSRRRARATPRRDSGMPTRPARRRSRSSRRRSRSDPGH